MSTILEDIVARKREELVNQKATLPINSLRELIKSRPRPANLAGTLISDRIRIIAEVKRASPSKGTLMNNCDPISLAKTYRDNGAAAISVLTDPRFKGSLEDLTSIQQALHATNLPILRKDFIFDEYQVYESAAYGADAILLIVSLLSRSTIRDYISLAQDFWVQCIVEVHDENELDIAIDAGSEIIGINNRNLATFEVDFSVTKRLAALIPRDKIIVSESGISNRSDIILLKQYGVHAALVGEALVTSEDIGAKVRELV